MTVQADDLKIYDRRIAETMDIVFCGLSLQVDKTYKRAHYQFSYKVRKRSKNGYNGDDQWFGVIPYPPTQVRDIECTKSSGEPLATHNLQDGRTIFLIPFGKEMREGEEFSFSYSYRTRIESIVEDSLLRTSGNVSYYIAHVSPCYNLQISLTFERPKTRTLKLHPNGEEVDGRITFEKQNVSPMEFYIFNCLYETGLSKRLSYVIDHSIWVVIGILGTLLADWIVSIFRQLLKH